MKDLKLAFAVNMAPELELILKQGTLRGLEGHAGPREYLEHFL